PEGRGAGPPRGRRSSTLASSVHLVGIVDKMVNISVDSGYHAAVRFALLGLGEAGGIYARALAGGGATVTAADPAVDTAPEGVVLTASIADAVADADLVLSLVGARAAEDVLVAALASMRRDAVFADLNTGAPEQKS